MINPFSIFHKKKETENVSTVSEKSASTPQNYTTGKYTIYIKLNGKEFESTTDDLKSAILSAKPKYALKTRVSMKITRADGKKCEKFILVPKAKMMFNKEAALDLFIRTLIFK